jgi:hypothetical protein
MSANPEAVNSPDDGGVPDGARPNPDSMSVAALKKTPYVCGQDRPLRIPRRSQHRPPEVPEGA